VCLYQRPPSAEEESQGEVTTVTVQAPARPSVAITVQRLRWQLPDKFTLTYQVIGDKLMHPPAYVNAANDIRQLAHVLSIDKSVVNSECLTWARFNTGRTVEEQWHLAIGCKDIVV
jgi:hypothetical protein